MLPMIGLLEIKGFYRIIIIRILFDDINDINDIDITIDNMDLV